ncbi:hypothetical protein KCP78_00770 [Salmonella enterica subsp. enterica]|nr:hypothetical protein KCP78_00770 [Salmonella enterica subsp. enterica]
MLDAVHYGGCAITPTEAGLRKRRRENIIQKLPVRNATTTQKAQRNVYFDENRCFRNRQSVHYPAMFPAKARTAEALKPISVLSSRSTEAVANIRAGVLTGRYPKISVYLRRRVCFV